MADAMTTLEERRQWVRVGCPVPKEHGLPREPCRYFRVGVQPSSGGLFAECLQCGVIAGAKGMHVVGKSLHKEEVVGAVVGTLRRAITWMNGHGKGEAEELWKGLTGSAHAWQWIQDWARLRMADTGPEEPCPPVTGMGWRIEFSSVSIPKDSEAAARAVVVPG